MKTPYETQTFRIPEWALYYIIDDDPEMLTDDEIFKIDKFLSDNHIITVPVPETEKYFASRNDICDLSADCYDIECLIKPSSK